jgi:hypothetical protein
MSTCGAVLFGFVLGAGAMIVAWWGWMLDPRRRRDVLLGLCEGFVERTGKCPVCGGPLEAAKP